MLQERILAAIGFFTYSIPVPLAHLSSEVRVRDTIIENGWYLGLKSIFQTTKAIISDRILEELNFKLVQSPLLAWEIGLTLGDDV